MRTAIVTLSLGMAITLLACGLSSGGQKAAETDHGVPGRESPLGAPARTTPPVEPPSVASLSVTYDGPSSIEERILKSPVIARVRLDSATSTVGVRHRTGRLDEVHSALGVQFQRSGVPEGQWRRAISWPSGSPGQYSTPAGRPRPNCLPLSPLGMSSGMATMRSSFCKPPRPTLRARNRRGATICLEE